MPYIGKKPADIIATAVDTTTGTFSGAVTVTTADNTDQLTLVSTDADANVGPILRLNRDSGSPADSDTIGSIVFNADNDASETTEYVRLLTFIGDASNGSEDAFIQSDYMVGGTLRNFYKVGGGELVFNEDAQDVDFRVESDTNVNAIFVQGSSGNVGMGTNNPAALYASDLVVVSDDEKGMTMFASSTTSRNYLAFADGTSGNQAYRGFISYDHNNDELSLGDGATTRITMTSGNMKIEDGNLIVGTSGHGIDFSATANSSGSMSSELLDDYEEGTWTPTVSTASAGTDNVFNASYVKIGKIVTFNLYITWSNNQGNNTNEFRINGLPFTAAASNNNGVANVAYAGSANISAYNHGLVVNNTNYIALYGISGSGTALNGSAVWSASFVTTVINGFYEVA